ncbi:MAG: hypothetical protein ACOZAN_04185 [Patescibacteria group bacterium]
MKITKEYIFNLLKNPGLVFLFAAIVQLCSLGINQAFVILGLPEIATEADNLSQGQIWTGFLLGILRVILSLTFIVLSALFTVLLLYLFYRFLKPTKASSNCG